VRCSCSCCWCWCRCWSPGPVLDNPYTYTTKFQHIPHKNIDHDRVGSEMPKADNSSIAHRLLSEADKTDTRPHGTYGLFTVLAQSWPTHAHS
jgi:hypothetical protein